MVLTIALCLYVFTASYLLTGLIRRYAFKKKLIDIPNLRSSHDVPTPRGGGFAVVIVFLSTIIGLTVIDAQEGGPHSILVLILSSALIAGIGFWDDHQSLAVKWRFLVHFIAATGALFLLPELPRIQFFSWVLDNSIILFFFYSLMLVWLLNLYNFMDGIDGLAGVEAMTTAGAVALLLGLQGQMHWALISLLLAVCVGGFLVWNWPPAKIFMGDACSGFLGFILGLMALMTSISGGLNMWCWWILMSVFIVDATTTLCRRILRGEIWYRAHRSHAYQILSRRLNSHKKVTQSVLAINVFWLLPWAYVSVIYEAWAPLICIVATAPLCVAVLKLGAGTTND